MSLTDDDPDDTEFHQISELNFNRVSNSVGKIGYADGVHDGKEKSFQIGFDQGYADGLRTGFAVSKYNALCKAIRSGKCKNEKLLNEAKHYDELQIPKATDQIHFQLIQHMDEPLEDVSKYQHEYVEKHLQDMAKELPLSTDLFVTNN